MKNKILLLICAFFLVCINVNAAHTCEYKSINGSTIKIIEQSDGQYTVSGANVTLSNSLINTLNSKGCSSARNLHATYNVSTKNHTLDVQCNDCSYNDSFLYICNCPIQYSLQNEYGSNDAGDKNGGGSSSGSPLDYNLSGILGTEACPAIFGNANQEGSIMYLLKNYFFTPVRIITPIILILLTSLDFAKAVFADEKDGMKKAKDNFLKRAVAALIIFLAPTIVSALLSFVDWTQTNSCARDTNNNIMENL